MSERKPRKDAVRNRAAALAAADTLFAQCRSPEDVTMADIAAEPASARRRSSVPSGTDRADPRAV